MYLDCHVHCRDEKWAYKETIAHALDVARDSLVDGIFDMPNVPEPIISRDRVLERLGIAEKCNSPVAYYTYVGVTANPDQIKEAVKCYDDFFPINREKEGVIGLKMFAGKSVGDLSVVKPDEQRLVYKTLSKLDYRGVLAVHCEKESDMKPELWNPEDAFSHCLARPLIAEENSIKDQIGYFYEENYKGHLHILHITSSRGVEIVDRAKKEGRRISCGVTPHHLLLSEEVMRSENGILYKVNPPLRAESTRAGLFLDFRDGKIDILESDHAPHTLDEKLDKENPMSGIVNLASWLDFVELLKARGVSQQTIDNTAFNKINKIFRIHLQKTQRPVKKRIYEYVFDPYIQLTGKIK